MDLWDFFVRCLAKCSFKIHPRHIYFLSLTSVERNISRLFSIYFALCHLNLPLQFIMSAEVGSKQLYFGSKLKRIFHFVDSRYGKKAICNPIYFHLFQYFHLYGGVKGPMAKKNRCLTKTRFEKWFFNLSDSLMKSVMVLR